MKITDQRLVERVYVWLSSVWNNTVSVSVRKSQRVHGYDDWMEDWLFRPLDGNSHGHINNSALVFARQCAAFHGEAPCEKL